MLLKYIKNYKKLYANDFENLDGEISFFNFIVFFFFLLEREREREIERKHGWVGWGAEGERES